MTPIDEIQSSDAVSAFRLTINEMLPVVNAAATWSSGTLAARPAANSVAPGRFYFSTDTSKLYQSDGTTWTLISDPFFTGTLAARPAANSVPAGAKYRAIDTGDLSVSDGTTWFTLTPANRAFLYLLSQANASSPDNVGSSGEEILDLGANAAGGVGTYVFTAPVKGVYRLDVFNPGGGAAEIRKNGSTNVQSLPASTGKGLAVQLNAGDTLGFKVTSGTVNANAVFMVQLAAQLP